MRDRPSSPWVHRFAVLTAVATVCLIVAGGLVTSTESGLSVPDWPTSYGWSMFTFPVSKWVGGIRFEHTHRLIASAVGLLTVALAIGLERREPRAWVRKLGYSALGVIITQGLLGGLTVLFLLPTAVSVAHACLAQTFFCLIVALSVVTSPRWRDAEPAPSAGITWVGTSTVVMIFGQLLLGAVIRHTKAGLAIPDFPLAFGRLIPPISSLPVGIHFAHRVGALAVAALVGACVVQAVRSARRGLQKTAATLTALVLVQIALGAATVLSRKAVLITTAHVVTGALLLGTALVFTVASLRAGQATERSAAGLPALSAKESLAWK
ncbi:MAG TPA: COX15/CtaA family protein [Thermoanaerobaculia bacterium]|nr:COX15/CtaA family protein [Thermoanaerobaculia bacterium]